jgi:N-methylhydantoinase A/oxoprolinase/acetone carboxylase beta subunit
VELARLAGHPRVLGFDMGGTSTDVSLADGAPREAAEASIDGFPVRVPMLDIHTVGAGGGSIARVDEGGLLRVGPESAGANPGPACYGAGEKPTVTDAHVVLGRIAADQLVGGALHISPERASAAVDTLAAALHLDRAAAAAGILRVANANMERAIRVVSVERGHDPRDFALLAFGGCGGLHACEMAAGLGIRTVLVPAMAGALSALGMLLADDTRDYAATALGHSDIEQLYRHLERRARRDLKGAGLHRTADLRYAGQSYELNVPWNEADPGAPFHREHQRIYGFSDAARPTEIVTVRVRGRRAVTQPNLVRMARKVPRMRAARRIWIDGRWLMARVSTRDHARGSGPALIVDYGATTLIPPGWRYRLDRYGTLIVQHPQ